MYIPKAELKDSEEESIRIWKELMPNWKGSVMIFPTKVGNAVIDGGKIFKLITKAVKNAQA
jgi:hypothetical protein